jgi:glycosyltransferase involved in cell wall biosynthesis
MKIFAISVVKNEADIIQYSLKMASRWADKIFVLDNGSTDGTWEKVLEIADDKIIPWKQEFKPFYEGLRGEVFNHFRSEAQEGDWWCFRLDADEFYADDPREFLPKVPARYHFVQTQTFEFQLTTDDLQEITFTGDAAQDIPHIRYYNQYTYAEARFFRHRVRLQWEAGLDRPRHIGIASPVRIRVRHYQYRSPEQLQRRIATRIQARQDGFAGWEHAANPQWMEYLQARDTMFHYTDDAALTTKGNVNQYTHKPHVLLLKRIFHGLGIWP